MGNWVSVQVNGVPIVPKVLVGDGSPSLPGFAFSSDPRTGVYSVGGATVAVSAAGSAIASFQNNGLFLLSDSVPLVFGAGYDLQLTRESSLVMGLTGGAASTNYRDLAVSRIDFRQAASTFSQTATITNGPRAANPVTWLEVKYAGTTGRIPVW